MKRTLLAWSLLSLMAASMPLQALAADMTNISTHRQSPAATPAAPAAPVSQNGLRATIENDPTLVQPNSVNKFTPTQTSNDSQTLEMLVPAQTVIPIKLQSAVSSEKNAIGDAITATVTQPITLGPYIAIPAGSTMQGKITHINKTTDKEGHHPYVVIQFDQLLRGANQPSPPDFHARLIAYKNGLRGEDYIWNLPTKGYHGRSAAMSVVKGAAAGIIFNPVFGPLIGGGAALVRTVAIDRFARGGQVELTTKQEYPLAVDQPFTLAVQDTPTMAPDQPDTQMRPFTQAVQNPAMPTEALETKGTSIRTGPGLHPADDRMK